MAYFCKALLCSLLLFLISLYLVLHQAPDI